MNSCSFFGQRVNAQRAGPPPTGKWKFFEQSLRAGTQKVGQCFKLKPLYRRAGCRAPLQIVFAILVLAAAPAHRLDTLPALGEKKFATSFITGFNGRN